MKIVPDEPTKEMVDAGFTELDPYENSKDHVYNTYYAMLAAAPSPWISVEDQLPETEQVVLAYFKGRRYVTGQIVVCYSRGKWSVDNDDQLITADITHWMPLHPGPKAT